MHLHNVTLELSLKPFWDPAEPAVRAVCRHLFEQWKPLLKHARQVSVLLWCADGSEILEYTGDLDAPLEWARYLGGANPRSGDHPQDPDKIGLHARPYLYRDDPPTLTYRWLRGLVAILKDEGRAVTGLPVRVGETFDPGPEFARSPFKYERHNEICVSGTLGQTAFVCAHATLHVEDRAYAGLPDGIAEGMPFGTFFGRQCRCFFGDLGFDYLWLSNGFGFGTEPWGLRGVLFDGERFDASQANDYAARGLEFWRLFRAECGVPLEVRGTNLSTGIDLASDAVPLRAIYRGGFDLQPPPNSPWAAINGDFGIELVGWMSHIAELPGEGFPYRFYTHDPWWLNSPWLDRYGREPHDIYLPLAVSRLDAEGRAETPDSVLFLTADDSHGELPDQVPNEVIPHLLTGLRDAPDAPGPLVWVYPFDEYHDWTFDSPSRADEVFAGDWFVRAAVNAGLPLNTVISTANVAKLIAARPDALAGSVLFSPVPAASSAWEDALLAHREAGGGLMLYGPLSRASERLRELLGVTLGEPLHGDFELRLEAREPNLLRVPPVLNCGGLAELAARGSPLGLFATQGTARRAVQLGVPPEHDAGAIVWLRGIVQGTVPKFGHLILPPDRAIECASATLARLALEVFGWRIEFDRRLREQPDPMLCVARHANGWFFSGYAPDTTVRWALRCPAGAPLLHGCEVWHEVGLSTFETPRAWHREVRVFVHQQAAGPLSCREVHVGQMGVRRRMLVTGLSEATVRFYPEPGTADAVRMLVDPVAPYFVGDFREPVRRADAQGEWLEVPQVTGALLISW